MSNELTTNTLFKKDSVKQKFEALLGKKSQGFISSVLQIINNNQYLKNADPMTVLNASATAATLDLPINQNLGFAWIVPYKGQAQFQMGWKGYVQLALRTGQYERINVVEVYENQFESFNRLTEHLDANFDIIGDGEIVGYASYFRLKNGMEKMCYWSKEEVTVHAKKYSQSFGKRFSPWSDKEQFHAMAKKTVLKNMISKWGIMSIEMQTAHLADQSIQKTEGEFNYDDNPQVIDIDAQNLEEENSRFIRSIENCTSIDELELLESFIEGKSDESIALFNKKKEELNERD